MIQKRTVFVLGAGASKPFGFPTGQELRSFLCDELQLPSSPVSIALSKSGHTPSQIAAFVTAFEHSGFASIDRFLAMRPELARTGTIALAASIATFHKEAALYTKEADSRKIVRGTSDWYGHLWNLMIEGADDAANVIRGNKVGFITFNYDLSLERFIYNGLLHGFRLDHAKAAEYSMAIPIHHVYGALAADPTERYGYAHLENPWKRGDLAERIQVMPHQRPDEDEECVRMLSAAEQIFFLGFGFDAMNCHRLGMDKVMGAKKALPHRPNIYGTALGLSDQEASIACDRIGIPSSNVLMDMDCLSLLRKVAHSFV